MRDGSPGHAAGSGTNATSGNLADLLRRAAARAGERAALIFRDQVITWSDLDARVDAVAAGLRSLDVSASPGGPTGPDEAAGGYPARVAVALPNVPEFAVAYFGALRAGLVAVPVNPGYSARELGHVLADSGATVLIGTDDVVAAAPDVPHRYVLGDPPPGARRFAELAAPGPVDVPAGSPAGDLAVLLYTSGTAGEPKGAMLSHRALLANHAQVAEIQPPVVGPDDVVLLAVPLFHAYGLNSALGAVAYHGATGVLLERFDPADSLGAIRRHQVTAVLGVPPMYVAWSLLPDVGDAFTSVRVAVSGAAPLDPDTQRRFLEATGRTVFEGYGLTETAPVLTSTLTSPVPKPGSIGRAVPGVEVRLVGMEDDEDEDDDYAVAMDSPGSDPGEIVVRGENLFGGYWPDGRDGPDADGWWPTGDVAYADAEGDLFLVDRIGELILVSGFNVYPREVEQVLVAHPAVAEAAVVGVPHPYTGQTIKAYVVVESDVTADALVAHCEKNLARFKCPTAIAFVPALPHSVTGKVRKRELT